MPFHAQGQRLDAPQDQVGIERPQSSTRGTAQQVELLAQFRIRDHVDARAAGIAARAKVIDEFLKLPHQEARHLSGVFGDTGVQLADFTHLPTRCGFIALMPQWDFLNFLARQGTRYPNFHLRMEAEATGLTEAGGRVTGLRVKTPAGVLAVTADLVVGADGRHSTVRALTNSCAPISGFDSPSRASSAICCRMRRAR